MPEKQKIDMTGVMNELRKIFESIRDEPHDPLNPQPRRFPLDIGQQDIIGPLYDAIQREAQKAFEQPSILFHKSFGSFCVGLVLALSDFDIQEHSKTNNENQDFSP